jgi:hypothetical protein
MILRSVELREQTEHDNRLEFGARNMPELEIHRDFVDSHAANNNTWRGKHWGWEIRRKFGERNMNGPPRAVGLKHQWKLSRTFSRPTRPHCEYRANRGKEAPESIPLKPMRDVCANRAARPQQRPRTIQPERNRMLFAQRTIAGPAVDALTDIWSILRYWQQCRCASG